MKKKVLIVTPGYYPAKNYGGPVISIMNLIDRLKDKFNFFVITSNYEFKDNKKLIENNKSFVEYRGAKVLYLNQEMMKQSFFYNIVDDIQPDIVYINSLFYYKITLPVLKLCKKKNIPTLIAPRGGLCKNALQFGKIKKIGYITFLKVLGYLKNSSFQSTSDEETEAIKKYLKKNKNHIYEIPNLPSLISVSTKAEKTTGKIKVIFFSRIHPKKNLLFAIECLQEVKGNVIFDIFGPKEDENYWEQCKKEISKCPNNIKITYKGYLNHEDISTVVGKYHLFFFPTLSENYGHVIVESLLSGCPVLLSNNTPWNDVTIADVGRAYDLGEKRKFVEYIEKIVDMDDTAFEKIVYKIPGYLEQKLKTKEQTELYRKMFYEMSR